MNVFTVFLFFIFWELFEGGCDILVCVFLFVRPPAFCSFFSASRGESSVFINREDTSISVAVMHTG